MGKMKKRVKFSSSWFILPSHMSPERPGGQTIKVFRRKEVRMSDQALTTALYFKLKRP